jgi:hypothetical protein
MKKKQGQSEKRLHRNIALYSDECPEVALFLPYVDCSHVNPIETREEAERWFASLDLDGIEVLYIYGIGLGYHYEAARDWLKKRRKRLLVFLEDDRAAMAHFFHTTCCTKLLRDKQVRLYFLPEDDRWAFDTLQWELACRPFALSALHYYTVDPVHAKRWMAIQQKINHDAARMHIVMQDHLNYRMDFYRNFYANAYALPKASLGNALFEKFKNMPAIICGAGPSLEKNVDQLEGLKEKVLIFAGGSALNALLAHGIIPHFGGAVDPYLTEIDRLEKISKYRIPLFYNSCLIHEALNKVDGPRLYVANCREYPIVEWLENALGIDKGEEMDEGHNVINFLLSIATQMGCNPILFVGLDLAFTDMKTYAKGVVDDADITQQELLDVTNIADKPQKRSSIDGREVYTDWRWIWESEWISAFAKENASLTIINATEGGIGFEGIANEPLKSVSTRLLVKNHHLTEKLKRDLQELPSLPAYEHDVKHCLQELRQSFERCVSLLQTIVDSIEHEKVAEFTLAQHELSEEIAYRYVLDGLYQVLCKMHGKLARFTDTPSHQRHKRKLQYRIYAFLEAAALEHLSCMPVE